MYYLAPKISRQDQVVEKEARMARRGSPEIFSDQGSPVLPVQSAKSFYANRPKIEEPEGHKFDYRVHLWLTT